LRGAWPLAAGPDFERRAARAGGFNVNPRLTTPTRRCRHGCDEITTPPNEGASDAFDPDERPVIVNTEAEMRDRVLTLEIEMRHMTQTLLSMKESQDDTNEKVTELRDMFLQGKGAAWAGRLIWLILLGIVGALGLKLAGAFHWIAGKP
jgi:hypothetical protein